MLRPALRPLLISGFLILSTSARPAAAQTFVPVPIGPVNQPPTTTLMPFTADAYPKVSTATGGMLLKTTQLQASGKEVLADRLLVKFQPTTSDADRANVHLQAAGRLKMAARPVGQISSALYLVDVSGAPSLEQAAQAYSADPRVLGVGPDTIGHIDETPNDPRFSQQWDMAKIQAPAAWNRTHGGGSAGLIAVLDTGIDETHPDLAPHVALRKDFTGSSTGTRDINGHGTHVAGIVGAVANNTVGIAGTAYSVDLINVKVADDGGSLALSSLVNGIYWATENGAGIINMSLGANSEHFWDDCDPSWAEDLFDFGVNELQDAINDAWSNHVVLVATAGNKADSFKQWPGSCPHVLSVANTNQSDVKAPTSSFGTWVDVAAPGESILSTLPGGGFGFKSGSSMAAPHVAGLAGLVRATCSAFDPQAVVDRITSTADPIPGTGSQWQFGRINALNAVCFNAPGLRAGPVAATSITVRWNDAVPGENRFELFYGPSGGPLSTLVTLPPNTTEYVHNNVAPGARFDYQVKVCDVDGCSPLSNKLTMESNTRKLTVTRDGLGSVTGQGIACGTTGVPSDCSEIYSYGTTVTLTAKDFVNSKLGIAYIFDHWEGACTGTARTCTVNMTLNRTVNAVFEDIS